MRQHRVRVGRQVLRPISQPGSPTHLEPAGVRTDVSTQGEMTALDVLKLYAELEAHGIPIWIDGGWCVDALLGQQTRAHPDLDIAVERKFAHRLERLLHGWGYQRRA